MSRIDFFIHPEFPLEINEDYSQEYRRYLDALLEAAGKAAFPIHIARDELSDFNIRRVIPAERRIIAFDDHKKAFTTEFDRLKTLCEGGTLFVFHGAYYLQCVITFIQQAYAFLEYGFRWLGQDIAEPKVIEKLTKWIHAEKELAKSGRYLIGVCYCYDRRTRELIDENAPSWLVWKEKYPHEQVPF